MNTTNYTYIPGKQEIIITRLFDAPRELVWKVFTDPKLISQWWGPRRLSTRVEEMDVRPGGTWRFINIDADGTEYGFHGVYHLVEPPERLIYTFEFEGAAGHVSMETVTLEDLNDKTKLTEIVVFQSVEDRDAMIAAGMESGSTESMDRFEELALEMKKELIKR